MAKQANRKMIGAFVILAVGILAASIVIFGSGDLFKESLEYVLYFEESLKGLSVGSPVLYHGFPVGQVNRVVIHADITELKDYILVYVEVYPESVIVVAEDMKFNWKGRMSDLIDHGLRGQLVPLSLVTGKLAVLLREHADTPIVRKNIDKNYEEIPTIPSTMSKLEASLANLDLQKINDSLISVLDGVDRILQNPDIDASLSELRSALGDARGLMQNVNSKVDPLADNLNNTLTDTRALVNNVNDKVDPLSQSVAEALQSVDTAFKSIDDLVGKRSPTRAELDNLLKELSGAARSLRVLADYLQQHPEALIKGKAYKNY
ncbi:MAG: MlaD family protein [Desulfobacterales bacterium]|nr:MlaD family protein [Desulfobacterales bacterium]MDJ0912391.1 MlaD family protein [Desulfobacterales bacterium]